MELPDQHYIPGPSCPFVLLDVAENRIAELEAAVNKARMLMLGDTSINASDKLECASYALDESRIATPEPEVCEWTWDQQRYTTACGYSFPTSLMKDRCICGKPIKIQPHDPA